MNREERRSFAEAAEARVLACVRAHGADFPSARTILRETGLSSLSTVHKYLHRLACAGRIALPSEKYAGETGGALLGVRHKRLRIEGGEELVLSFVLLRGADGRADVRVVRCARPGAAAGRILACDEAEQPGMPAGKGAAR